MVVAVAMRVELAFLMRVELASLMRGLGVLKFALQFMFLVLVVKVTAMLLLKNVKVFISLLHAFSFWGYMFISWLGLDGLNFSWYIVLAEVQFLRHVRLHFKNEMPAVNVGLRCTESGRIGIESCVVGLMPSLRIKIVKVIAPMEIKTLSLIVVGESLYIVIKYVPGHISRVESLTPRIERWCPKIHHDGLAFADGFHCSI